MDPITPSELRANLKAVLDCINEDHETVAVVRGKGREVIMMDAEDYRSIMETFYLTRNPANAERLQEGIKQHREGQHKEIDVTPYLD